MLDQLIAPKVEENKEFNSLKEEFASFKKVATPPTRMVKLKLSSWCGCGGTTQWIEREVPYDSPLNDGDDISDTQAGDKKSMEKMSTGKVVDLGFL